MAVLIAPSGLTLVQEGLKRALGRAGSSGEQARGLDQWLPEIKNDIWMDDGGSHQLLEADGFTLLTEGTHIYSLASDFDSLKAAVILDGDVRLNARSADANRIRLSASDGVSGSGIIGQEIVTLSGTGLGQKRQIVGFDDSTGWATVDTAWTTIPDSSTLYLRVSEYHRFDPLDPNTFNRISDRTNRDRPSSGMIWNDQLYVQKAPDRIYPMVYQYWANILKVDTADTDTNHQNMMANWRSLFQQGVFYRTLQNEDDIRADQQYLVYRDMITKVTHQAQRMGQVEPHGF